MAFFPKMLTRRSAVGKVWYESNRESDNVVSSSLAIKLSNTVLLVIMVFDRYGTDFLVPLAGAAIRRAVGDSAVCLICCWLHLGLLLWPCAYFLTRILLKQTRLDRAVEVDRFDRVLLVDGLGKYARIYRVLAGCDLVWQMRTPKLGAVRRLLFPSARDKSRR